MFSYGFNFRSSGAMWWCLYSLGWLNWHQDWLLFSVDLLAREIRPALFCSCCCWSSLHVCHLFAKLDTRRFPCWSCNKISPFSCRSWALAFTFLWLAKKDYASKYLGPSSRFHLGRIFFLQGYIYLVHSLCHAFIFRLKLSHSLIMRPSYI